MSTGTIRVGVEAIEVRGPGLPDFYSCRAMLAGGQSYRSAPMVLEAPPQLSAAERRRAIPSVKLALGVAAAAVAQSKYDPTTLPAVFASSGADGETIAAILTALATPQREVSPTRFHNSVHNAPSGYWGVAVQSRAAVTSISCYDASFAAGLLEAAVQATVGARPTSLIAYDLPYPHPLAGVRPITASFGVALVLSAQPSDQARTVLRMRLGASEPATTCIDPALEALRISNPAARSLPLLIALATGCRGRVLLDLNHGSLEVDVLQC